MNSYMMVKTPQLVYVKVGNIRDAVSCKIDKFTN
jgi:hypothetical protein